jgi:hypothetical protein
MVAAFDADDTGFGVVGNQLNLISRESLAVRIDDDVVCFELRGADGKRDGEADR